MLYPMTSHETRLRVRYAETDQMGIVYHANYLIWMEVGRVEYCRAAGLRYKDLEAEGINLAVVEAKCRYLKPARYDQEIAVVTTVVDASPRMVEFRYDIRDAEQGETLTEGRTRHFFVGRDMRLCKLPERYRAIFGTNDPGTA
jgi:acyl-CoA thioester hydrolase